MTNTPTQAAIEAAARAAWDRDQQIFWEGSGTEPVAWESTTPAARALWRDFTTIAIEAYRAALREAGVVEVPVEPTQDMVQEGWLAWRDIWGGGSRVRSDILLAAWREMIAARPQIGGE